VSSPKKFTITESIATLKAYQKSSIPMIATRIRALIEFKIHEKTGISKREVASAIGVNHNSVQTWRTLYIQGGIESVMSYQKNEGRPSSITKEEHDAIEKKLHDPQNGLRGYVELVSWMEETFNKTFRYNTVVCYCRRHFHSKIKVARKSHAQKDEQAVSTFKKTLVQPAKTSMNTKPKGTDQ
jgi:transposase